MIYSESYAIYDSILFFSETHVFRGNSGCVLCRTSHYAQ